MPRNGPFSLRNRRRAAKHLNHFFMDQFDEISGKTTVVRTALGYGDNIDVFHIGRLKVVQRYACIRRDQFEWTTNGSFPESFRAYLALRGPIRGGAALYILDIPNEFQLTVAPMAGRAVFMPRLSTDLAWQKNVAVEIISVLDELMPNV
jgi:hypothetical protein